MSNKPRKKRLLTKINICLAAVIIVYSGYLYGFRLSRAFREIVDGKVYSSKQPTPEQLAEWIDKYGIKTVICLRGYSEEDTPEEVAVAEKKNVRMINFSWSAYNTPRHPLLKRYIKELETCQTPILIHCRSGIDRSGTAAAMAAMEIGKEDYFEAKRHSFVPAGPWKRKKRKNFIHVSDVFKEFEDYCRQNDMTPNWELMKEWARTEYRSYYSFYNVEYTLPEQITVAPGQEQVIKVGITNMSHTAIPCEDAKYKLFAYLGDAISRGSDYRLIGPYTPLPEKNIEPNETVTLEHTITAPDVPGEYEIHLNIDTEFGYNFESHGSAIGKIKLIVSANAEQSSIIQAPSVSSRRRGLCRA